MKGFPSMPHYRALIIAVWLILTVPLRASAQRAPGSSANLASSTPASAPLSQSELLARIAQLQQALATLQKEVEGRLSASPSVAASAPSVQPSAASAQPPVSPSVPASPTRAEPFFFADWSWLNGNAREKDTPLDTKLLRRSSAPMSPTFTTSTTLQMTPWWALARAAARRRCRCSSWESAATFTTTMCAGG